MDTTADTFHVSPQQEQLWVGEPESPSACHQVVLELDVALEPAAIRDALGRAVERHESLRTTFVRQPGLLIPLQAVHEHLKPGWSTLQAGDPAAREQAVADELSRPFDLTAGPLLRAVLIRQRERHDLVLTASALIADPSSLVLLAAELCELCSGGRELVEEPLQYADFAAWQREQLESQEDEARQAEQRRSGLSEVAAPELPFTRSASGPFAAQFVAVELPVGLLADLEPAAARYAVHISVFVQAAWHALLGRYTGEETVTVGYVSGERRHADLEGAIGVFSRPIPLTVPVGATVTFAELAGAIDRGRDDALVLSDYLPADGVPQLAVGFVAVAGLPARAGGPRARLTHVRASSSFPLALVCLSAENELRLGLDFDPRRHRRADVERLAAALPRLLRAAATEPGLRLGDLDLLGEAERRIVLAGLDATAAPLPGGAVFELIAAHAVSAPERTAVADEQGTITYAELDGRANQLARRLQRAGVGPDACVGLCTDRSIDMVVGMLGILKAGAAYVPLHHEHPRARLRHQLETVGAQAIVAQEAMLEWLPEVEGEVICLDRDRASLASEPTGALEVAVTPEHLAYVIYTSGSTGTPKGVLVTHGNVVNYAAAIARRLGADSEPRSFGMVTSIATDLGNTALFGALCSGGTLVLVSQTTAADPGAMARRLEEAPVDILKITPSHLGALLAAGDPRLLPRRVLVLGGERAPWDLIERVRALGQCAIVNHYGPTETTIGSCTFPVGNGPGASAPASVPIGTPIDNTACYVLDPGGHPVPLGVLGRLFIAGAGVARGYAGAPELTAERFVSDPFSHGRMYDTGDLARWLPEGVLEFLGRADEQVKIRGYRVEPAEIEAALRSHPAVVEAVALARPCAGGEPRLVAYCAIATPVSDSELRAHLTDWLPEFMLPSAIITLDRLPQTPSGKVDRQALPDPDLVPGDVAGEYQAPRTPVEEAVTAIWSQVLGVSRLSVDDDFFALGGHSLLATQVVAQIRSDFAVELPLHSLFTFPTVATLTAEIVGMMGDVDHEETDRLMAELEGMSDEEAQRLLDGEGAE